MTADEKNAILEEYRTYDRPNKVTRYIPILIDLLDRHELANDALKRLSNDLYNDNVRLTREIAQLREMIEKLLKK